MKLRAFHALIIVHLVHKVMYLPANKGLKCKHQLNMKNYADFGCLPIGRITHMCSRCAIDKIGSVVILDVNFCLNGD